MNRMFIPSMYMCMGDGGGRFWLFQCTYFLNSTIISVSVYQPYNLNYYWRGEG